MADPIIAGKFEVVDDGNTVLKIDPSSPSPKLEFLQDGEVIASYGSGVTAQSLRVWWPKKTGLDVNPIHELHASGTARFGAKGSTGQVIVRAGDGRNRIRLNADWGACMLGGNGLTGMLALYPKTYQNPGEKFEDVLKSTILLLGDEASIRLGDHGADGDVNVFNRHGTRVIHLDGAAGDIALGNADCAEEFDVDDPAIEPGSVLVLDDEPGRLRVSDAPYDTRVAGILSGAGTYRPAIVLDRQPDREGRRPVALAGKTWCKVEAESAPVRVGSLLTTSSLPGHAMAATDRGRAFGAVLGKALAPLAAGVGVVPVLVALQ
jgi:hypothetical protein